MNSPDPEMTKALYAYFQAYRDGLKYTGEYITDIAIHPYFIRFKNKKMFDEDKEINVEMTIMRLNDKPIVVVHDEKVREIETRKEKKKAGAKSLLAAETGLELTLKIWWFMWMLTFFYPIFEFLFSALAK